MIWIFRKSLDRHGDEALCDEVVIEIYHLNLGAFRACHCPVHIKGNSCIRGSLYPRIRIQQLP
jgi:hypothetical protein